MKPQRIVIVDSGGANIASLIFALERLDCHPVFTREQSLIESSDRVLLPGVGSARYAMDCLTRYGLDSVIRQLKQPVLGICLGMQLLFKSSEEGNVSCLGLIPQQVVKLSGKGNLSIPHMGWNELSNINGNCPLASGIDSNPFVYFVHSYYAPTCPETQAVVSYGENISAIVQKDNFYGCQFHPEKSGKVGSRILKNFLEIES